MSKSDDVLQKSMGMKKSFHYAKGDVTLDFTLTVENSSQLRRFLACLIEAQKDIEETLKGMKN